MLHRNESVQLKKIQVKENIMRSTNRYYFFRVKK